MLQGVALVLGIVATALVLYDRAKRPALDVQLLLHIGGFELRISNRGSAPATGIRVGVFAWQCGSPGAELTNDFTVPDLGPGSDSTIYRPMDAKGYEGPFQRLKRLPISGYVTIACTSCAGPKAWAFHDPEWGSRPERLFTASDLWPIVEFKYPKESPRIDVCVDFPIDVCNDSRCPKDDPWTAK